MPTGHTELSLLNGLNKADSYKIRVKIVLTLTGRLSIGLRLAPQPSKVKHSIWFHDKKLEQKAIPERLRIQVDINGGIIFDNNPRIIYRHPTHGYILPRHVNPTRSFQGRPNLQRRLTLPIEWHTLKRNSQLWDSLTDLPVGVLPRIVLILQLDYGYGGFGFDDDVLPSVYKTARRLHIFRTSHLSRVFLVLRSNPTNFFVPFQLVSK